MLNNLIKKYSYNKELLVLKYNDISKLKDYNITKYDGDLSNFHSNHLYDLVIFEDYLEHMNDKEIEKTFRLLKRNAKEIIFDTSISNYFCGDDYKNINYKKSSFYKKIFEKYDYVLIEERSYRKRIFEKHKIFVICSK